MPAEVETMFSAREVPWHGLGTIVADVLTAKEALVAAGLDWEVGLQPVFVQPTPYDPSQSQDGFVEVEDKQAVVRDSDGSVLEIVGSRYTPVQNWKSFEFFDSIVDSGDAKYETAGALKGGRVVWMTAKVNREMLIGGVDPVDLYLLIANSHDGSMAFTAANTPVRTVCQNTLNLALRGAQQKWVMRHTESIDGKVEQARQALALTFAYADEFQKTADAMIGESFTKAEFERMMKDVFPDKVNKEGRFSDEQYAMIGVLESSPTIDDAFRYSRWGALNAVREYDDWGRSFRESKTKSEAETRTERAWFGPNVARANKTLEYLSQ